MKRKFFIPFAFATLTIVPVSAIAQIPTNGNPSSGNGKYIPIDKRNKEKPDRPKMPSQQHIECLYADGTLHFFFAIPEGECLVTVTDSFSGMSTQHSFDSAEPAEVYVGEIQTGCIEIQTANGNQYTGIIE